MQAVLSGSTLPFRYKLLYGKTTFVNYFMDTFSNYFWESYGTTDVNWVKTEILYLVSLIVSFLWKKWSNPKWLIFTKCCLFAHVLS